MKKLTRLGIALLLVAGFITIQTSSLQAHCQIPCGIYDDQMRFDMIAEHITTIEKSMKMITELEQAADKNYNQIVRWVNNKDQHADELANIVTYYFLAQRVKPVSTTNPEELHDYGTRLELLHQLVFYAMKAKQTVDTAHVGKLREVLEKFHQVYFGDDHHH